MAAAAGIAGRCAVYYVVPFAAGILVFASYAIGRSLGRPGAGLIAAWLVATSPTFLFMAFAPMSDVPAAAAWAVAVAGVIAGSPAAIALSALSSALAILIRPNLAPLALLLLAVLASRRRFAGAAVFAALAATGAIATAAINARLYGSPTSSGYDLNGAFALANVAVNLRRYGWWLLTVETPLAAGLVWLVWSRRWLLAAFAAAVWFAYLVYVPWDAWWYLRFLLPGWPMMAFGAGSLLSTGLRARAALIRACTVAAIVALGAAGVVQATRRHAFDEAAGESKYVEVARTVAALTRPEDVIVAAQHSGTLRYYGGRLTLRWDVGDPAWFDRTVDWLAARGHRVYFVLEESEAQALRERAGAVSRYARLDWPAVVSFRGGNVKFYDPLNRDPSVRTIATRESHAVDGCVPPLPTPALSTAAGPPRLP
jgi:hypothetical protein